MVFSRILIAATLAVSSVAVQAGQAAADHLAQLLGKAHTLSARFSQLTLDASGTHLQETSGEVALKRPGQLRWHTDAPMEQLLVSDGLQVWLYDPDLEQVTIQALDQRLTHTPALLLSGDVSQIQESFDIEDKASGDVVDFILRPKSADTLFDSLRLSFRAGVINDMQLVDSAGQRTNILFMGVKMNDILNPDLFTFTIPDGVDVIQD